MPELYYLTPTALFALFVLFVVGQVATLLIWMYAQQCRRPHHQCQRPHADDRAAHRPSHRPGPAARHLRLIGHPRSLPDRTVMDGQVLR